MNHGNTNKVMADAKRIARRLRKTKTTLTKLMTEYHCSYELMIKVIRLQIPEEEWQQIHKNNLLQQRWYMLTNPHEKTIPSFCEVAEQEITEHLFCMDAITPGRQLSKAEMDQCRERFRRFCQTQYENRNIN